MSPAGIFGIVVVALFVGLATFAGALASVDPFASVAPALSPPSRVCALGTDDLGRDVWSGVVHGARTSLLAVVGVTLIASVIGVGVGAAAGAGSRALDDALMRLTEFAQIVPRFFLAVVVIALVGSGLDRLILVLGLTSWPPIARVVRAETLSITQREFVTAARALGARPSRVVLRHVLPHALPAVLVVISLTAAGVVLLEASLAFIGLGDPHAMSWGYLAHNAHHFFRVAWWLTVFPGIAIVLTIVGLNLLADGLNDLLERRGSREGRARAEERAPFQADGVTRAGRSPAAGSP